MIAYRTWTVSITGELRSLGVPYTWHTGLNSAFHHPILDNPLHPHDAPGPDCMCGIWVLPSLRDAESYMHRGQNLIRMAFVVGTVETYGRHVEHEFGIRCEKAQVTGLYSSPRIKSLVRRAAMCYDAPIL